MKNYLIKILAFLNLLCDQENIFCYEFPTSKHRQLLCLFWQISVVIQFDANGALSQKGAYGEPWPRAAVPEKRCSPCRTRVWTPKKLRLWFSAITTAGASRSSRRRLRRQPTPRASSRKRTRTDRRN